MGGKRKEGVLGTDAPFPGGEVEVGEVSGGAETPGPVDAEPLADHEVVDTVERDWDVSSPKTTPKPEVSGQKIEDVFHALNALPGGRWGRGGGEYVAVPTSSGDGKTATVKLSANLVKILPEWKEYDQASAGAKASWDKMIGFLDRHEKRHVEIAAEDAEKLATKLVGKKVAQVPALTSKAGTDMQARQDQLDVDSENGTKQGHPYGDVVLEVPADE